MAHGGYREGSGRSKAGYYKGIYCGSTYELAWAIYNLDHKIVFSRFSKRLEKDGLVYYPDFILKDNITIVELKGYEDKDKVDAKTRVATSYGFKVKVLRKDNLKKHFNYVKKTYNIKQDSLIYKLYDGYKPKFKYKCTYCKASYRNDKKLKTQNVFCSRSCAGNYRKENRKPTVGKGKYKRQLNDKTALKIYQTVDQSYSQIANIYKTSKNIVWAIKTKKAYKHIHS